MTKTTGPENPVVRRTIEKLRERDEAIWRDVADRLSEARRDRTEVNLSQIVRNTEEDEIALVPGKVLGSGKVAEELNVAALEFSKGAREKIEASGGTCLTLKELIEQHPDGEGVRIIG